MAPVKWARHIRSQHHCLNRGDDTGIHGIALKVHFRSISNKITLGNHVV